MYEVLGVSYAKVSIKSWMLSKQQLAVSYSDQQLVLSYI